MPYSATLTSLTTCCRGSDNPSGGTDGAWRFPNNDDVSTRNTASPSEFSRNRAERAILLHRGINAMGPTGIFTCVIPDGSSNNQNVYFGIYNENKGEQITFSPHTCFLPCTFIPICESLVTSSEKTAHFVQYFKIELLVFKGRVALKE